MNKFSKDMAMRHLESWLESFFYELDENYDYAKRKWYSGVFLGFESMAWAIGEKQIEKLALACVELVRRTYR